MEVLLYTAASSGSVTINSDGSVQILAEEAAPLEDFDLQVRSRHVVSF